MASYLVKCYSNNHMDFRNILVEASSKEEAKSFIRDTPLRCGGWNKDEIFLTLTPVGAREVIIVNGWKIFVKDETRTHRDLVEATKVTEEKNFVVTFKSKKDGRTKETVVKATNSRQAKKMVEEFGSAIKAELAKGRNKMDKPSKRGVTRDYKEIKGVPVYRISHEELVELTEKTSGWCTSYIETAGSVNSGMTKY